jgi:hypothetical protein
MQARGVDQCDVCQARHRVGDDHDCKRCGSWGGHERWSMDLHRHVRPCGGCRQYFPIDHKHWAANEVTR